MKEISGFESSGFESGVQYTGFESSGAGLEYQKVGGTGKCKRFKTAPVPSTINTPTPVLKQK